MTRDEYEEQIRRNLKEHREKHPDARAEDVVKFVFQGFLGAGHLLGDPEETEKRISLEMRGEEPSGREPLTEAVSPSWCRLNLRRAKAENLTPRMISGMMYAIQPADRFTETDVERFCRAAAEKEREPEIIGALIPLMKGNRLPSHSRTYREKYRPAYRVVSDEWRDILPALCAAAAKQRQPGNTLITIDGPCASGKTTLAGRIAGVLGCGVLHTDEFVVPHAMKTPERLAVPGGNCDWERLVRDVLRPWKQGTAVLYQRYDCRGDRFLPPEELKPGNLLILEGSYSGLPAIRALSDVRIFMNVPEKVRMERLKKRESSDSLKRFLDMWIPLENAYFATYGLPDGECFLYPERGNERDQ